MSRSTQTASPPTALSLLSLKPLKRRKAYDPKANGSAGLVRLKATCAYDGTCFRGWMIQSVLEESVQESVQGALEARLSSYLKRPVPIAGSGRTDAGVSARAQVFHVDVEPCHAPDAVLRALQSGLPPGVQVTAVELASERFHARHSCIGKRYSYTLLTRQASPFEQRWCWSLAERRPSHSPPIELDLAAMRDATQALVGRHDFSNFCVIQPGDPRSPVRHVRHGEVTAEDNGRVRITIEADRFLYKQMRMMVGTLAQVGLRKLSAEAFRALILLPAPTPALDTAACEAPSLAAPRHVRSRAVYTAPAQGLMLEQVLYANPGEMGPTSVLPAAELSDGQDERDSDESE